MFSSLRRSRRAQHSLFNAARSSLVCRFMSTKPVAVLPWITREDDLNTQYASVADNDVFVVSSSSRGIGREMTRQLLSRTKGTVIGLERDLESARAQNHFGMFGDRFQLVHCDLENQSTIEDAATQVQAYLSAQPGARLAGLFNVAGILGTGSPGQPPEKTIRHISREWMSKSLQVNTLGPIMLTQALLPALKQRSAPWSVVCNLSARVGSIKDNRLGGWYSYRLSKAALNQFTKTASIELKRDKCMIISLHPGTTDTELSEPFQRNVKPEQLFPVWYSAMMMLDVVFDLKPTDTGKFYAYDGSEIDW